MTPAPTSKSAIAGLVLAILSIPGILLLGLACLLPGGAILFSLHGIRSAHRHGKRGMRIAATGLAVAVPVFALTWILSLVVVLA